MIVVDDPQQPQSPGERSPLKSPTVTTREGLPQQTQPPPPPPYAAGSYERPHSYQSVPHPGPGNLPPPVTVRVVRHNTALERFIRALGVALIILFLWGMFVDSLQNIINRRPGYGGHYGYEEEIPSGIEWIIRDWYKPTPATPTTPPPCSCSHHNELPVETGRTLPVEYPPVISQTEVQFSINIPTSTSSPS